MINVSYGPDQISIYVHRLRWPLDRGINQVAFTYLINFIIIV